MSKIIRNAANGPTVYIGEKQLDFESEAMAEKKLGGLFPMVAVLTDADGAKLIPIQEVYKIEREYQKGQQEANNSKQETAHSAQKHSQADLSEGDIIALLDDWWPKTKEIVPDNVRVNYNEVDASLGLPSGSTKKYIAQIAKRKGFKHISSGNVVAVYEYDVTM